MLPSLFIDKHFHLLRYTNFALRYKSQSRQRQADQAALSRVCDLRHVIPSDQLSEES